MENIRETLMVFDSCGDTDKERGRGKVTGWTVGVKRKLPCPGNARTDHTDIYIYIHVYIYICFLYLFCFLRFRFPRLSRFSFTRLFAFRPLFQRTRIINRGPVTSRHLSSSRAINTIGRSARASISPINLT